MKTRHKNTLALLTTLLCLGRAPKSFAQILLGADPTSGTTELVSGNGGLTLGWEFQVSAPSGITLNGLGFWDDHSDGFFLGQTFDVGLWNSSGTLLAESVITSSSTLMPSLDSSGGWRVNTVSPTHLASGLYTVGALFPVNGANGIIGDPANFQTAPGINLEGFVRQIGSSTLAMPNIGPPYPGAMWFGPTFTFSNVPEPNSKSLLLLGFGLAAMFGVFKRQMPKHTVVTRG